MTTVAYDGKELVSDSRMLCGECIEDDVDKLFELNDGSLFAGAGIYEEVLEVLEWMNDGQPRGRPTLKEFVGIHIKNDGTVWQAEEKLRWWRVKGNKVAIGSGSKFARVAMRLGLSARKAVELAAEFDSGTNCALQIMKLSKQKLRVAA